MPSSTNLGLPYIDANQNQKHVTHNTALRILDALAQIQVQSAALTAPPGSPADGQVWIVAAGATGAWLGKDLQLAAWQDGAWAFYPPRAGYIAYNVAGSTSLMWTGSAWSSLLGTISTLMLSLLGIGTAPDSSNPLSVTANAALFSAKTTGAGGTGDMRVKISKQAAANTASFLFQDNFSGRAEIGLTGDDNFHFKVSANGSTFNEGILIDRSTGSVTLGNSRTAVSNADYTALTTDRMVAYTALTAARTVTLPSASSFPAGTELVIADESGACSATNAINVNRAGSDTINGGTADTIVAPYGFRSYVGNGGSKWTRIGQNVRSLVSIITSSGTYAIPSWARRLHITTIGGGGGGGSGASGDATANRGGGGGGASGARSDEMFDITEISGASLTIAVGSGGNGAAGVANASGTAGAAGGTTTVSDGSGSISWALGGGAGGGGSTAAGAAGNASYGNTVANAGAAGGTTGAGGSGAYTTDPSTGGGGGGGGGVSTASATNAGGAGGYGYAKGAARRATPGLAGTSGGGTGGNGSASSFNRGAGAGGGGGGSATGTTTGGNGGNGGVDGGGGGGGGACRDTATSGGGGNGGDGAVYIAAMG